MEMRGDALLLLGAYGLAGRAILKELAAQPPAALIAAGRDPDKLRTLPRAVDSTGFEPLTLDVADDAALRRACARAALVVNAVGPYAQHGAEVARAAIESGCAYVDCANEQVHYQRLRTLDATARDRGVPMVTAAGAIPGCTTLLMALGLQRLPTATAVDCYWAQRRHAYHDGGLASVMSGVLEAGHRPVTLRNGSYEPVLLGRSQTAAALPDPFGAVRMIEVPTIDVLTVPQRFALRDLHVWVYMGGAPTWLLGAIRAAQPQRRPWAYRLIEHVVRRSNAREFARAAAAGIGPECLLQVVVRDAREARTGHILFRDGACATAYLPALLAREIVAGRITHRGLATPLDLLPPQATLAGLGPAALTADLGFAASPGTGS